MWSYLRRKVANAVLAGFNDALETLESQSHPQHDPVPLPEASHGREAAKEAIALVVTAGGAQIGKDAPMDVETLSTYLAARVQTSRTSIAVLVQADRDIDYGVVSRVLQACRAAGVEEVALATRKRVGER